MRKCKLFLLHGYSDSDVFQMRFQRWHQNTGETTETEANRSTNQNVTLPPRPSKNTNATSLPLVEARVWKKPTNVLFTELLKNVIVKSYYVTEIVIGVAPLQLRENYRDWKVDA